MNKKQTKAYLGLAMCETKAYLGLAMCEYINVKFHQLKMPKKQKKLLLSELKRRLEVLS